MTPALHCADALAVMRGMPDASVQLIVTDPPYFRVKDEPWDNQWDHRDGFLAWFAELCQEWRRILKDNGSLYVFASPGMSWHVEGVVRDYFQVLNHISWQKPGSWSYKVKKEDLRAYFADSERILFAEHFDSDDIASTEAGYKERCKAAARATFGDRIRAMRERHGLSRADVTDLLGCFSAGDKGASCSNWEHGYNIPGRDHYDRLEEAYPGSFDASYEHLRQQYEQLRQQYEHLRRTFNATAADQFTDVWSFPVVASYPGKHPCEKPLAMMTQIVRLSSRPGDTVLDCFMGTGNTGVACGHLGRHFIGIDASPRHFNQAQPRIMAAYQQWENVSTFGAAEDLALHDLPLFA